MRQWQWIQLMSHLEGLVLVVVVTVNVNSFYGTTICYVVAIFILGCFVT